MPAKGITSVTLMERVATVLELIGSHTDQAIVVQTSREWGISKRQAWKYVKAAHRVIGQRMLEDRRHALELCVASYQRLHRKAMQDGEYMPAIEALDRVVRLLKLHDLPIEESKIQGNARSYSIEPNQRRTLREITSRMDDITRRRGIRVVEVIEAPKDLDVTRINAQMNPDLIQDAEEVRDEEPGPDQPDESLPRLSDLFKTE